MAVRGRWLLVGGVAVVGALVTWALYQSAALDAPLGRPTRGAAAPLGNSPSTLWLLAVGVSRYDAPALNLRFADVDARAMADSIAAAGRGGLYREVRTLILTNEEVTRESLLDSMERFLGRAGPDDVALLFLAGHGVRDLASGSYYFLPHAATADNLRTEGLRVSDIDEALSVLRRNVRAVVVMLDTCHAGALGIPSTRMVSADEMAGQMSVGDGFFLLAATKPGEESKEKAELGHGAFTFAVLEGVAGAADADRDGTISVSELFGYVARRVPILTLGDQHPYHKTEGTDLVLLTVEAGTPAGTALPRPAAGPTAPPGPRSNSIGVMEFQNLRNDQQHEWISKALRVAFNTELSKVKALRVYSPELIDRTAKTRGADYLFTARQLGIGRLLTGSFHVVDDTLRIDAHIVDADSGLNQASDSVEGNLTSFFDLQKQLVLSMLRRLRVQVSAEEGASIETETNTDVDAYRLLLESEGVVDTAPEGSRPAATPTPAKHSDGAPLWPWLGAAHAAENDLDPDADSQVRAVLEAYRKALEEKDVDRVATLYTAFAEPQRAALRGYLQSATELRVELADIAITPQGAGVAATFTRRDRFVDQETGKPVRLEVRLTKMLVREGGTWKIGGGK